MIKETLCEHCVFKKLDDKGHQSGCMLGRTEKLPNHKDGKFVVIDTFCNACRNVYWMQANKFSTMHEMIQSVKTEIKMSYDIIASACDADMNLYDVVDISKLDKFINHIVNIPYKFNKAHIIVKMTPENLRACNKYKDLLPNNVKLTLTQDSVIANLATATKSSKAGYLVITNIESKINNEILLDFENSMNELCLPKILHTCEDFYLVSKFLYEYFMYSDNPFERISEYVNEAKAGNQCTDSQS